MLLRDTDVDLGVAAPYEPPSELHYEHLFSMNWSLITPPRHPLTKRRSIRLRAIVDEPLIVFERGSTGRQHVLDAFHHQGLSPCVNMETTTTEIVVQMVEAGLGIAIVPLLPSGAVTHHRKVAVRPIADPIRHIDSGVLTRRCDRQSAATREFIDFIRQAESPPTAANDDLNRLHSDNTLATLHAHDEPSRATNSSVAKLLRSHRPTPSFGFVACT